MRALCLALVALLGGGCHLVPQEPAHGPAELDSTVMLSEVYDAVDRLMDQHADHQDTDRILAATAVDVNDVRNTSMFGRVITEAVQARLTQRDHDVIHATVREDHLVVRSEGQFLLSRDVKDLAADYNARTALVTTYAVLSESVIVSLKLVSTVESSTLAAQDLVLRRTDAVTEMLERSNRF